MKLLELYESIKGLFEIESELSSNRLCSNCDYQYIGKSVKFCRKNCYDRFFSMSRRRRIKLADKFFSDRTKCPVCDKSIKLGTSKVEKWICPKCDCVNYF